MFRTIEISNPDFTPPGVSMITVKSPCLRRRADISCYVPPGISSQRLPLVLLLHGIYGSHWSWLFKGGAHEVLSRLIKLESLPPMMLAMPSDGLWGDGSGYTRHLDADYAAWIVNEVPAACAILEPNVAASPRFIAGLSMGGYGALRLGAIHAEHFSGISAHSSATGLDQIIPHMEEKASQWDLDESFPMRAIDCLKANSHRLPPLRFDCGLDDALLRANRELHEDLDRSLIPHEYKEFPGGHDWTYWHTHLEDSLRFFSKILQV